MITGFDHVVIAVRELAPAVRAYETLLGPSAGAPIEGDGVAKAIITIGNIAVELIAPAGDGEGGQRLRAAMEDGGEGLKSLVFAVNDLDQMHRRCERVGLAPEPIVTRERRRFRVGAEGTHGVRVFFIEQAAPAAPLGPEGYVLGLDHIVIRTPEPERAAALYGARIALDMRLDRDVMGRRLMFFRCGDAIVELVQDEALAGGRDRLWGLSWRVANADAAQARLVAAGLNVSDVRTGMKPATRVFTVRDGACGVPTLMIENSPNRD